MEKKYKYIIVLFLLTTISSFLNSCKFEDKKDINIPKTQNKTFNALIESATSSSIDFDKFTIDTLFVDQNNIIGNRRSNFVSEDARLGRIVGMVSVNDSLYVADQQQNCVWVLDSKGTLVKKIGRGGKGPNEFGMISGITNNNDKIFTAEASNARIKIFNDRFYLQTIFNHVVYGNGLTGNKSFAATDSFLYLASNANINDKLVEVRQVNAPFDSQALFLPRIIPPDMQPKAYNNFIMDANKRGEIVVSYTGLPYVLIYDNNHNLKHTIYLRFPKEELTNNPSIKPVRQKKAIGIKGIMIGLSLTDDGKIYVFNGKNLYQISRNNSDKYDLEKAWFFTYLDKERRQNSPVGINATTMTISDGKVYFGSIFREHIYRFQVFK